MRFYIYKGMAEKIQRKIYRQTIFALPFYCGGRINLIPSPECYIFIALSGDTHIDAILGHFGYKVKWPYDHILAIWPYGHMDIWPKMASIWVSPETAMKKQHSGEGIKLIRPS